MKGIMMTTASQGKYAYLDSTKKHATKRTRSTASQPANIESELRRGLRQGHDNAA
jgi:hypothetical protein